MRIEISEVAAQKKASGGRRVMERPIPIMQMARRALQRRKFEKTMIRGRAHITLRMPRITQFSWRARLHKHPLRSRDN